MSTKMRFKNLIYDLKTLKKKNHFKLFNSPKLFIYFNSYFIYITIYTLEY